MTEITMWLLRLLLLFISSKSSQGWSLDPVVSVSRWSRRISSTSAVRTPLVPICPLRHFCCRMYRLATKCTTKNEVRNAITVYGIMLHEAYESKAHGSFVNNDTLMQRVRVPFRSMQQRYADCGRVRLRTQIRSNCWIRGLTANGFFFYSEVEILRSQWIALKYCMQYDPLSEQ